MYALVKKDINGKIINSVIWVNDVPTTVSGFNPKACVPMVWCINTRSQFPDYDLVLVESSFIDVSD